MVNTQNIVGHAKNIIWVHIKELIIIIIIIIKLVGKYNTYHEPLSIQGMDREEIQILHLSSHTTKVVLAIATSNLCLLSVHKSLGQV